MGNQGRQGGHREQLHIEPQWIEKIRQGDSGAFERLFYSYCQPLVNFARRIVHDTQIAENIVQDVFLRIWTSREKLDPNSNIKSYLYTAVRNESFKHFRHQVVEQRAIEEIQTSDSTSLSPEDEWKAQELNAAVQQAVAALPEKCRIIFSMNRYDQLTYKEIAEIQKISLKTVETQMSRALKFLRQRLIHFLAIFP